ncbi:OsmC family protein [Candidatus Bathyarchaeota archaeon]|nr:OsmC family protein [Candidatus Bathyarchaeota archaeon]
MNNVNLDQMQKFIEAVRKDPETALKEKSVSGEWIFEEGKTQFVAELPYQKGIVPLGCEMPPFAGGWGSSPDPMQYCLYGLAACFATTFAATATGENVKLKSLKVTAENRVDLRKQLGLSKEPIIQRVGLRVEVDADVPRSTLERLVRLAEERCPGAECVTRNIPLSIKLE